MLSILNQLNIIIPNTEKKKLPIFLVLNLLTMLLETIGIVMIIPLMSVIVSGDFIYEYQITKDILNYYGNPPREIILIFIMIIIVFIFLIKNILMGLFNWWQISFAHKLQLSLSHKLYENYMFKDYLFHTKTNSSHLIRNTSNEPNTVRSSVLQVFSIITQASIIIAIVSFLIFYDPIVNSIVIASLFMTCLIFYLLTRNKIAKWGKVRLKMSGQTLKDLTQGFGGIKDIKILGKENFFIKLFKNNLSDLVKMNILMGFVRSIPKLLFELLGIIIIFILILLNVFYGADSLEKFLTTLSLFVVSFFKILPSATRLIMDFQALRYRSPAIEHLSKELESMEKVNEDKKVEVNDSKFYKETPESLELKEVSFSYDSKLKGLKNISFIQKSNTILGVFGPSGSGKSTLINLILGLIKPDNGEILFNNKSIFNDSISWQKNIGYIPQNIYLIDDSIKNNIALGVKEEHIDSKLIDECIKMAELDNLISNLPNGLDTLVGERGARISGGELQRVGIARALYQKPKVLILDEATSALDILTEKNILDTIYKLKDGKIVILISHRESIYNYCNEILKLIDGNSEMKKLND